MSIIHSNHHIDRDKVLPISLFTACTDYPQEHVSRPKGAGSFHQIMVVTNGTGVVNQRGNSYALKKGCAFFVSKTEPVEYFSVEGLTTAFLTANGSAVDSLMAFFHCDGFLFRESVNVDKSVSCIDRIIDHNYEHKQAGTLSALVYAFYADFFEQQSEVRTGLDRVVMHIEKSFGEKLTLSQLATVGCMSVSKLSHDFKRVFGVSIFQYILELRLNYARTLLISNPKLTTKEIARSCGFDDVSYFCRAYKAKFLKTPKEAQGELSL